jgi:hypothetical protein
VARVTVAPGIELSDTFLALIRDAAKAAGIDPAKVVITQGSWHKGALSGDTHNGNGAADIRVWNLPSGLLEKFVVELRRRGGIAWLRDRAHGWTSGDHIHVIWRDAKGLSSGAKWQVAEYDKGHDGLSRRGPDYHPRPKQYRFVVKPKVGTATVVESTWVRKAPDLNGARVKQRNPGTRVWYSGTREVDGLTWLRLVSGNWILSKRTSRGA